MPKRKVSKKDDRKELEFLWGTLEVAVRMRDISKILDIAEKLGDMEVGIFE